RAEKRRLRKLAADQPDEIDEAGRMPKLPVLPRPASLPPRPESSSPTVLSVEEVSVRFGGLVAVDRASLTVPRGQIVGLIGPNGAGKSTLFNAVSGFVRPASGVIGFGGAEVQALAALERPRRGICRRSRIL